MKGQEGNKRKESFYPGKADVLGFSTASRDENR
jgi:hypothetical protein